MTNQNIVLPAIALRGTTILPGMIVHFDVSRERSVKAIEAAMLHDQKIFLVTQIDPEVESPDLAGVYHVGTIAYIKQVVKLPQNLLRVLVEGTGRATLVKFEQEFPFIRSEITPVDEEEMQMPEPVMEAMHRSLKLDLQESDIKISQLEKKANKKLITAKLDGTVTYVGDSGSGETTDGKALIKIKSSDGFYVVGSVSELMLDDFKEGTKLNCTSYTSGSFEADVMDVSEYPVTGNSFYGSSNPNVSYYAFTAVVSDKTLQLEDQDWVTVNYEASAAENIMVIQKAFVRNDNNKNYVYKDDNGILKKQEISVGAAVDSGYSVIVKGGLSEDDLIAFPYGKDVKEGAKTKEVTLDQMYGY